MSLYSIETYEKRETPQEYWDRRAEYLANARQTLNGEALTEQILQAVNQGHYTLKADEILLLHVDGFVNTEQALRLEEVRQATLAQQSGQVAIYQFVDLQAA